LYIGDFGNNGKTYKQFYIYKVLNAATLINKTKAETISFRLPKTIKPQNFEAFFLWNNYFYLFSKDSKNVNLFKVPNLIGKHTAEFISVFNFKTRNSSITSCDISKNGEKIILLNNDKIIVLSNFSSDDFFNGTIDYFYFNHTSQKEGICFKTNNKVLINDEYSHLKGGNIYEFSLPQ